MFRTSAGSPLRKQPWEVQLIGAIIRFALPTVLIVGLALAPSARADAPSASAPGPANGQSLGLSDAPSTDELQALTRTLENPSARDQLIGELRALVAARHAESGATAAEKAKAPTQTMGEALLALLSARMHQIAAGVAALAGLAQWAALSRIGLSG